MSTHDEKFESISRLGGDSSSDGSSDHNSMVDQSPVVPSTPSVTDRQSSGTDAFLYEPMSSADTRPNGLEPDSPTLGGASKIESTSSHYNATMEEASDSEFEVRSGTGRGKKKVDFTSVNSSLFGNPGDATSRNTSRPLDPHSDPLPPLPHNAQTEGSNETTKRPFDFDPSAGGNLPIPVDPSNDNNPFHSGRGSNMSNCNPANAPGRLSNRSSSRPRVIFGGAVNTAPFPGASTAPGTAIPTEHRRPSEFIPSHASLNGGPMPIPHPFPHPHQGSQVPTYYHLLPENARQGFPPGFSSFSGVPNRPPSFITQTHDIVTSDGFDPSASLLGETSSPHSRPPPPILFGPPPEPGSLAPNVLGGYSHGPSGVSLIPGSVPGTGRSRQIGGSFAERMFGGVRPASMGAAHSHEPIHSQLFDDSTVLNLENKFTFNKDGSIASYDTKTTVTGPQGFHSDALDNASEFHTEMLSKAEEVMNEGSVEDMLRDVQQGFGPGGMRIG